MPREASTPAGLSTDPIEFELVGMDGNGRPIQPITFRCKPSLQGAVIADILQGSNAEAAKASIDIIARAIVPDQLPLYNEIIHSDEIIVDIQTLAEIAKYLIEEYTGTRVPTGALDITFYRDDVTLRAEQRAHPQPVVKATRLDFPLEGKSVVLVDDVLYTGRTIRSAIEEIFDYGRPERVQLAVLVDRGHRELPIRPDYVGKNLPTARSERVNVELVEVDELDRVVLIHP